MSRIFVGMVVILALWGCDRFRSKSDDSKKTAKADTEPEEVDSDSSEKGTAKRDLINLMAVPPIQVSGSELVVIAEILEAKRLELEQKERDLIQREQMVTRLESEALSQKDELATLQKDTQLALDNAASKLRDQYKMENDKLVKHWENIKVKHKEFLFNYLKLSDSEDKESLNSEIKRLQKERQQRIDQLLKTIEGMNPASCAMMITSMDSEEAVEVMSGLSSTRAAEVLSNMAPQKAAELARGMMGPKVPTVPSLEDIVLPPAPEANEPDAKGKP